MAQIQIGLAMTTLNIQARDAETLAMALDTQVRRDLQAAWAIDAEVFFLADLVHPPPGVWPIFIADQTEGNFAGLHMLATNAYHDRPRPGPWSSTKRDWQLAASHECLEMLVDPTGVKSVPSRGLALDGQHLTTLDRVPLSARSLRPDRGRRPRLRHRRRRGQRLLHPELFRPRIPPRRPLQLQRLPHPPARGPPGGYLSWYPKASCSNSATSPATNWSTWPNGANAITPRRRPITQTPRLHPEKFQPA